LEFLHPVRESASVLVLAAEPESVLVPVVVALVLVSVRKEAVPAGTAVDMEEQADTGASIRHHHLDNTAVDMEEKADMGASIPHHHRDNTAVPEVVLHHHRDGDIHRASPGSFCNNRPTHQTPVVDIAAVCANEAHS
jgi:hypothetical protein